MSYEYSTILEMQKDLFNKVDKNLITDIKRNIMIVNNITSLNFEKLAFIVNNPKYSERLSFSDIKVYIENDLYSTPIHGLAEIIQAKIEYSEASNYLLQNNICTPFSHGFQNNITITELVCLLASFDENTPDLLNYVTSDPLNNQSIGLYNFYQSISNPNYVASTAKPLPRLRFSMILKVNKSN